MPNFNRFRRFSLGTLLLVVTLISLYLGREWNIVRDRKVLLGQLATRSQRDGRRMHKIDFPPESVAAQLRHDEVRPTSEIVVGCTDEELQRIQSTFPDAVISEWEPPVMLVAHQTKKTLPPAEDAASEIAKVKGLTTAEFNESRQATAQRWWDLLEVCEEERPYRDYYAASLALRDADLAAAADPAGRIAARRAHLLRMQKLYLQRHALYVVGAAGGQYDTQVEAHIRWLEAEIELRKEEK